MPTENVGIKSTVMATIGKGLCCECVFYLHGQTENPCAKGVAYVGYLKQGCHLWRNEDGSKAEVTKKICSICGKELTIDKFNRDRTKPTGYFNYCKKCRKEKQLQRKQSLAQEV